MLRPKSQPPPQNMEKNSKNVQNIFIKRRSVKKIAKKYHHSMRLYQSYLLFMHSKYYRIYNMKILCFL